LYVAVHVTDENVISSDDRLELLIDTRPVDARRAENQLGEGVLSIIASAPSGESNPVDFTARELGDDGAPVQGVIVAGAKSATGYDLEFAIPLDLVTKAQGPEWHSVQMTLVVHDADEKGQQPTQIPWRGGRSVHESNIGYGYIVRQK
jgi:hypothetical protein